jgi:XTP/dITP diphosphohydrolase/tetrapyrrole methylase family protein/MazG family protein/ATP diphosphatase
VSAQRLDALERLDAITRRLRRECPWDREQDERSIVPHTVEEAYELADAARQGDPQRMIDELGDVLFQVVFLSLLLEERGEGDLAAVAESCAAKLVRRHPHVFGEAELATSAEVLAQWEQIKREVERAGSEHPFEGVAENLPSLTYARKLQRRGDPQERSTEPRPPGGERRDAAERWVGELLFGVVAVARRLGVDPELALRDAANRYRESMAERRTPSP